MHLSRAGSAGRDLGRSDSGVVVPARAPTSATGTPFANLVVPADWSRQSDPSPTMQENHECAESADEKPDVDSIARDLGNSLALRSLLAYTLADLWRGQPTKFAAVNTVLVQELGESLANLPAPDPVVRDLYGKAEAHASAFLDQVLLMAKHLSAARRENDGSR
jgi:hypothetical protein